jgi:hypothetical protein
VFRDAFISAKLFNQQVKEEVPPDELVFAPIWTGEQAAANLQAIQVGAGEIDDPDQNKEPEEDDHKDGFEEEEEA